MERVFGMLTLLGLGLFVLGLHLGIRLNSPGEVLRALLSDGSEAADLIIRNFRLPRGILAAVIGAGLGLAGLLMQTVTRNPIAEPGLLGINAGAAFAVVALLTYDPTVSTLFVMAVAAIGGLGAAALVFGLAFSTGAGASPIHMLLAGVTIAALLNAGLQVLIILDEAVMEELLFWLSGAFVDRPLTGLLIALPVLAASTLMAFFFHNTLDVLQTDDATAETLGVPVARTRAFAVLLAALIAGVCVAMAGPVAFVGLIAPHLARLSGARGHWELIPVTIAWGAVLALSADILARFVLYPTEAPVSAVLAIVGVPLLIWLLRRKRLRLI
ncbi:MAG: iron ABC transporter permease [Dinoroseobacter sp.]|nr:iron ABC transporter permease [Dinoroseobacter sp.]